MQRYNYCIVLYILINGYTSVMSYMVTLTINTVMMAVDNNECNDPANNECDQVCNNTESSYTCTCRERYYLAEDGYSCIGIYHHNNTLALLLSLHTDQI